MAGSGDSMTQTGNATRTTPAGWRIRWDAALAERAYAEGWWRRDTMADALIAEATANPDRILLVDGETRLSAAVLHHKAQALA